MMPSDSPTLARKIVMFPVVRIVIGILMVSIPVAIASAAVNWFSPGLAVLVSSGAACLAYYAFVRLVERREPTELGLRGMLQELGMGVLVGVLLFSVVVGALWAFGFYSVSGVNELSQLREPFLLAVSAGVIEEVIFRGILFRIVEEYLGSWIALAMSALIFGFAHAANPNASLFSNVAIALEAGILLGAIYMLTRRLWMVIGVHFAWNFTQSGLYGINVSGIDMGGLLESRLEGPELLAGGQFGAEATLFAVVICLGLGGYYIYRAVQKGHVVAPMWSKQGLD